MESLDGQRCLRSYKWCPGALRRIIGVSSGVGETRLRRAFINRLALSPFQPVQRVFLELSTQRLRSLP